MTSHYLHQWCLVYWRIYASLAQWIKGLTPLVQHYNYTVDLPCYLYNHKTNSLPWRHNDHHDVSNHPQGIVCSSFRLSCLKKRKYGGPRYWTFVRWIHPWLIDSPHKGPVIRNFFSMELRHHIAEWQAEIGSPLVPLLVTGSPSHADNIVCDANWWKLRRDLCESNIFFSKWLNQVTALEHNTNRDLCGWHIIPRNG